MSGTAAAPRTTGSATSAYLLVPILLFFALLIVAVLRSPHLITSAGIGSAVIVATPLVLATFALMAIAIAGRGSVDLSVGPLIGFINVVLVQLFGADVISAPLEFFATAIGLGLAYQLVMGLIIVFIRVQPIIVSLSGYLALSGINLVIMQRPGGTAPEWMLPWGAGTSILSPVLAMLVVATGAWLLFARTAFFGHLRLMGSDERAAYTAGVHIGIVRIGAHLIAGVYAALAAIAYTALISSGDPTQGTTYTLISVTALVLGGTSLAGGRGGAIGSLLGALNIYLITYVLATFSFGEVQSFVTDLAYGTILVCSLLLTVALPRLQSTLKHVSPLLFFILLFIVAFGVILHATYDYSAPAGTEAGAGAAPAAAVAGAFLFEDAPARTAAAMPVLAHPVALATVLLVALLAVLRWAIAQARTRSLSPLVYLVVGAVAVLAVYMLARPAQTAAPAPATTQGAT